VNHNLEMLRVVAGGFQHLRQQVVFVGGASVALYATDTAAPESRPTDDVDCVLEVGTRHDYHLLEEELRGLGFTNDMSEGAPICRWVFAGVKVDIMPTDPDLLGFSSKWCQHALQNARPHLFPDGVTILVLAPPLFLGTKIEALKARGMADLRLSPDFEDLVFILLFRSGLLEEIKDSESNLKRYLKAEMLTLLNHPILSEAIAAVIGYGTGEKAVETVRSRIQAIADLEVA
jgi:predicted nucleotidyltransferase